METKFNFNSQICTSRKQSERLLALGLKKETADVTIHCEFGDTYILGINYCQYVESHRRNGHKEEFFKHTFPAWSLHRLIEMTKLKVTPFLYGVEISHPQWERAFVKRVNVWDNLCDCIEWLIKEGYFNKEYLV